jgi:hypothetical protein
MISGHDGRTRRRAMLVLMVAGATQRAGRARIISLIIQ